MKLSNIIIGLVNHLAQEGDIEVELQDKDTTCYSNFFVVVESDNNKKPTLKLRSWPY